MSEAMQVINGARIPIKSWCPDLEEGALAQAMDLANHPVVWNHVALMPDAHQGMGMPIGGVIACDGAIIINAIGVDIGCGMVALRTTMPADELAWDQIVTIIDTVYKRIPAGFRHHKSPQDWEGFERAPNIPIIQEELRSAQNQLGTLGGGNHFIEIQTGDDGRVWLMVHSGSRNFGYKIAKRYQKIADDLMDRWHSDIPPGRGEEGLSFLPIDSAEGSEYINAMCFALEFAAENRRQMMAVFLEVFVDVTGDTFDGEPVNIHHNYAVIEHHFGRNLWVHRKGATSARAGQRGIIPGSMGTPSYIVEGLGNVNSYMSCAHGAGRSMGRKQYMREHTIEDATALMDGIYFKWGVDRRGKIDFSEAPDAYKDIDVVMANQKDLVKVLVKLEPRGVMKG